MADKLSFDNELIVLACHARTEPNITQNEKLSNSTAFTNQLNNEKTL